MRAELLLVLCCAAAQRPTGDSPYRRVVARALERSQAALVTTLDFEVDHRGWENPWVVRTPHYEVRATESYAQTAKIAGDLEYLHGEYVKLLGEGRASGTLLPVWVFPNIGAYNQFGQENGAEHSSLLGGFHSTQHPERPVVSYQNGNATLLGMWLTHAAVHQYLDRAFGLQPAVWVEEGLASYFALYWDWAYGAKELERIERGRTYVGLERLVADPLQAYAQHPDERFIELGMLFHFLLNSCEATKNDEQGGSGPFQEFLRAAVRGQNINDSEFARIFDEDAELIQEDFKNFDFTKR